MNGILFKPDMIKAIIGDRKTQTRRLLNPQPFMEHGVLRWQPKRTNGLKGMHKPDLNMDDHADLAKMFARYLIGDVVYIKEGIHRFNIEYASYDSDFTPVMFLQSANRFHWRWTRDKLSPMFLPHEAARYFIQITAVRTERLQEITTKDAIHEGIYHDPILSDYLQPIRDYQYLWDSINPKYPWASNPWCFVYTFKKVENPLKG